MTDMQRQTAAVLAVAPYIALVGVLKQAPDAWSRPWPMPWGHAAGHSLLLMGLMAAHCACYRLWSVHSPNRMLVNEFLTRTFFVMFGLLVVGVHGDQAPIFFVMASAWSVASWCSYYLVIRRDGEYKFATNLALLGLFLLGLALTGLVAIARGL